MTVKLYGAAWVDAFSGVMMPRRTNGPVRIGASIGASSLENAVAPEMMPQVIMMRAIQSRAPSFSRRMLLGTSNST